MSKKLILLRHGESQWNRENRFTGWTDIGLTKKGENEADNAGILLKKEQFKINLVYTSYLRRSIETAKKCLNHIKNEKTIVESDWRLNERHYGNLQGLNKTETSKKFGNEQVMIWRRSYDIAPPSLDINDDRHPRKDPLYSKINPKLLPSSESLKDTLLRVMPVINKKILPQLIKNTNILIVAHGNSLRAIIKVLKKFPIRM